MTKNQLWAAFVRKNPALVAANVSFSAPGIRKFFNRTFDIALEEGEFDEEKKHPNASGFSMPGFMSEFFNKKP